VVRPSVAWSAPSRHPAPRLCRPQRPRCPRETPRSCPSRKARAFPEIFSARSSAPTRIGFDAPSSFETSSRRLAVVKSRFTVVTSCPCRARSDRALAETAANLSAISASAFADATRDCTTSRWLGGIAASSGTVTIATTFGGGSPCLAASRPVHSDVNRRTFSAALHAFLGQLDETFGRRAARSERVLERRSRLGFVVVRVGGLLLHLVHADEEFVVRRVVAFVELALTDARVPRRHGRPQQRAARERYRDEKGARDLRHWQSTAAPQTSYALPVSARYATSPRPPARATAPCPALLPSCEP